MANQPQKYKQIKAEPADNSATGGSRAEYSRLQQIYQSSPLFTGYNDAAIEELGFKKLFVEDVTNDYFGTVSRNYANNEPPSYDNVETGAGGLPASAHSPNPASPLEGANRPDTIPEPPDGYGSIESADSFGVGAGAKLDPAQSSQQISFAGKPLGFYGLPSNRSSS